MPERLRAGVVGCGMVSQAMHLPSLRALSDRFEIAGLCDLDSGLLDAVGDGYGVAARFGSVEELVAQPLDALLVVASGDHAPPALAGLRAGLHVFVEKPLCLRVADGLELEQAARVHDRRLMVGFMKRYDPAFERACELLPTIGELRLVTTTTLEAPFRPYVEHHRLRGGRGVPAETALQLRRHTDEVLESVLPAADAATRSAYGGVLLHSLIHELDLLRGALGEPDSVDQAQIREHSVVIGMTFAGVPVVTSWADVGEGITRYQQRLCFAGTHGRITLEFPSPYLRHAPTRLLVESGAIGSQGSSVTDEIVSYEEAFERELIEFHDAVTGRREPRTGATDGIAGTALAEAIARVHAGGTPIAQPTKLTETVA
jgi:predicted dehydrogenase